METYKALLADLKTKAESTIQVEVDEGETSENISITAKVEGQVIKASNYAYLPAYQEFRDQLLNAGYGLKCNGSRENAVQSNMMGATDKIYLVKLGKQARREDMVSIWDYAELNSFPDTKGQEAFFEAWRKG